MQITKIRGNLCETGRALWEEVFSEDSKEFTDYYFENKAKHNIGYVCGEEPYDAMLFRTPYPVQIYDKQKSLSYIVGVATRENSRHQGKMTALMMTALQEMYREKNPFTFLMPANPAIYEPFDFQYIYERPVWSFKEETFPMLVLEPLMGIDKAVSLQVKKEIQAINKKKTFSIKSAVGIAVDETQAVALYQKLADFANNWLAAHADIYVYRNASYYETQLKESQAQNGDIFLIEENNELAGFFLYAREGGEIFVQEVMEKEEGLFSFLRKEIHKKPVIMARIVHLEEMLKLVRSPQDKTVLIEIEDCLIPENAGLYLWEVTPKGSRVTRQKEGRTPEVTMDIKELTPYLFGRVFLNEIV